MQMGRTTDSISWKYATGEITLIVVGVLIALTASDWQDSRADRRTELGILRQLTTSLSSDLDLLEESIERGRRIDGSGAALQSYLDSGRLYADTLDSYFGTMFSVSSLELNSAAYESLRSQGLGLISSEDLRLEITSVYEQAYPRAERVVESERLS